MNRFDYSRALIDEMSRYYDARAPWHDHYMNYRSNEGMEQLLKPVIDRVAEIMTGARVLEIACGTGNWTQVLARRAASVVATDVSHTALEIAKGKLAGQNNVSLIQCDAFDMMGIGGCFDAVFAADWWSHIPKGILPSFLEAVASKLAPGATAVFLDMSNREFFRREPSYRDEDGNRVSLRLLPDGSEYRVVKNFPDETELRNLLDPYGDNIDFREFTDLERWLVSYTSRPPAAT